MTDAFKQIGFNSGTGGYGVDPLSAAKPDQLAIMSEGQRDDLDRSPPRDSKGFFMTETDDFGYGQ